MVVVETYHDTDGVVGPDLSHLTAVPASAENIAWREQREQREADKAERTEREERRERTERSREQCREQTE